MGRENLWAGALSQAILQLFLAFVTLSSCEVFDPPQDILARSRLETMGETAHHTTPSKDEADTLFYVTCVEFPDGYDWRRDTASGYTECRIVLYRNFKRVLEVEAGNGMHASQDPDMHWVWEGHLYTEYSTDNETILKRDGLEVFRYSGREMICGFLSREDGIYTLGLSRSGRGMSYRKNGKEIVANSAAVPFWSQNGEVCENGALYEDGGAVCFAYSIEVDGASEAQHCYLVRDGNVSQVEISDNSVRRVHDMRLVDGIVCYAAEADGSKPGPYLYMGDKILSFTPDACKLRNVGIIRHGGSVFMSAEKSYDKGKTWTSRLWRVGNDKSLLSGKNILAYGFCVDGNDYAYVYTSDGEGVTGMWHNGYHVLSGEDCSMMTNACAQLMDDKFYVGLTPKGKGKPFVWRNGGKMAELPVNGYISSVRVWVP